MKKSIMWLIVIVVIAYLFLTRKTAPKTTTGTVRPPTTVPGATDRAIVTLIGAGSTALANLLNPSAGPAETVDVGPVQGPQLVGESYMDMSQSLGISL